MGPANGSISGRFIFVLPAAISIIITPFTSFTLFQRIFWAAPRRQPVAYRKLKNGCRFVSDFGPPLVPFPPRALPSGNAAKTFAELLRGDVLTSGLRVIRHWEVR